MSWWQRVNPRTFVRVGVALLFLGVVLLASAIVAINVVAFIDAIVEGEANRAVRDGAPSAEPVMNEASAAAAATTPVHWSVGLAAATGLSSAAAGLLTALTGFLKLRRERESPEGPAAA